jgi:hypothetical protein
LPPVFLNSFGLKLDDIEVMVRFRVWDDAKVGKEKGVMHIRIVMCRSQHGGDAIAHFEASW